MRALKQRTAYAAVAELLARRISSGLLKPGDQLLGERELSRAFDVSRVTVRRALSELRQQGLIESDRQRGWFVCSPTVGEPNALMGFSEMALSRGLVPSSRLVRAEVRSATVEEGDTLSVAAGSALFDLVRVRCLDDVPVAIENSRVPLKLAPALAETDFAHASLYDTLRRSGAAPARADYVLQAVSANEADARFLDVPVGSPLLSATAVTFDAARRPIELSASRFRGDRYRFRTTLHRSFAQR